MNWNTIELIMTKYRITNFNYFKIIYIISVNVSSYIRKSEISFKEYNVAKIQQAVAQFNPCLSYTQSEYHRTFIHFIPTTRPFFTGSSFSFRSRSAATMCNAITIVVWMNNQAPSRRAPNHSISVQSTSLLSRARQLDSPFLSLENHRRVGKRRERERERRRERGIGHIEG